PEIQYMLERRRQLGGFVPERRTKARSTLTLPGDTSYELLKKGSGTQQVASTMAFVRLLKDLFKAKDFGHRIVPIIPDEARTFGLDSIFPSAKIFNTLGQNYLAVDRELMLSYKESESGQTMHTGINEAGSAAAFQAVGTAYATHGEPMIPVYIFYSMFGFQRTGDQFWAAGDQLTRGFIIGATAGRTTLTGEGLQHADGHSPLIAGTNTALADERSARGPGNPARRGLRDRAQVRRRLRRSGRDRHVLPHGVQRADGPAGRAGGRRRRGHQARYPPHLGVRHGRPQGPAPRLRRGRAVGARGAAAPQGGLGRLGRRLVGDELERAAPRRAGRRARRARRPDRARAHAVRHGEAVRRPGPVRRHERLRPPGARPDPRVGARRLRRARGRRVRLLRHACGSPQ